MTPSGIEAASFRLLAQCLNCVTSCPSVYFTCIVINSLVGRNVCTVRKTIYIYIHTHTTVFLKIDHLGSKDFIIIVMFRKD